MLVLDPVSAPKWRLDCSRCSFLIYLPKELHDVKVSKERCGVRGLGLDSHFSMLARSADSAAVPDAGGTIMAVLREFAVALCDAEFVSQPQGLASIC